MPSLNTRQQMAFKGQKSMSFLGPKTCSKLSANIKTAAAASFTHGLKNEIAKQLQQ